MKHKMIDFIVEGKVVASGPHPLAPNVIRTSADIRRQKKVIKQWEIVDARMVHHNNFCYEWYVLRNKQGHQKTVYRKLYWPL